MTRDIQNVLVNSSHGGIETKILDKNIYYKCPYALPLSKGSDLTKESKSGNVRDE